MDREQIIREINDYRKEKGLHKVSSIIGTDILFQRGSRIWWLHYWGYGNCAIELSVYGVN